MPSKLAGAGSGALAGAAAGSTFGPIGAGIGGVIGGLAGFFSSGSKDKVKQFDRLLPEQKQFILNQLAQTQQQAAPGGNFAQAQSYLGGLLSGDPQAYQKFAAPFETQFREQTLPMLSERFASLGGGLGGGLGSSSGFAQALGGAATQYQSNLNNLYANLQQQAAQQAMNQYNLSSGIGLTPTFESAYQPGSTGFGGNALSGLSQGYFSGVGGNLANSSFGSFGKNLNNTSGNYLPTPQKPPGFGPQGPNVYTPY